MCMCHKICNILYFFCFFYDVSSVYFFFFFFQAEDGIRDYKVTGVQTCALPILDALAIAIGTSHGAYKFTRKPTGDILSIQRVKEIHARLPNTHLVMHGSSSVPQELLEIIRQYGGAMKETYGVPVEEIQEAIKHGVRKINRSEERRVGK